MDNLLSSKSFPPGFRFHPTDEELFMYYLKRKVTGKSLNPKMISDLDVYQYGPWDLPSKSYLKTCPRSKKYSGGRANRSTEYGYWKSTGNDRTCKYNNRLVGKIKTLIFHTGKPPRGDRTDWVMHEYRLEDKTLAEQGIPLDSFVICKVYKKSGFGPKNGENYGAPFVEEEWDSDDEENVDVISGLSPVPTLINDSTPLSLAPVEIEEDELDRVLAMFADGTMNDVCDDDFFAGLDDIVEADQFDSLEAGLHWSQSQYLPENGDGFMELIDLAR